MKSIHYVEAVHVLDVHSRAGSRITSRHHTLFGKIPGGWLLLGLVQQLCATRAGVSVMVLASSF